MTTKLNHTPGPWHTKKISGDWGIFDADGNYVAAPSNHSDFEEGNARLIAAVPEMVAALKQIATLQGYATWTGTPEAYIAALADVARAAFPNTEGC